MNRNSFKIADLLFRTTHRGDEMPVQHAIAVMVLPHAIQSNAKIHNVILLKYV